MRAKTGELITVRNNIQPGDVDSIVNLHVTLYAKEYRFNHTFKPYVAGPMGKFVDQLSTGDQLWIAEKENKVIGSVAIVKSNNRVAQLRWLIVHPDLRCHGVGKKLVEEALSFCRRYGYSSVFLWTINILTAALQLYTSAGFRLTETKTHQIWGRHLTEERYELILDPK